MSEPQPDPAPAVPPDRPARWPATVIVVVVALLAVAGGLTLRGDKASGGHTAMGDVSPLQLADASPDIAAHYRFAESHPEELAAIPCFCGCEEFLAHRNLYDCFVRVDGAGYDAHAAGCGVCIGESAVARRLLDDGMDVTAVRDAVVSQFGATPGTTPDQTTPRA